MVIFDTTSESVTFNVASNFSPFVALFTSSSSYSTFRLCLFIVPLLYVVFIMLSVRVSGVFAPSFAYVTTYFMSFADIICDNSSLYFPVTSAGTTSIFVT